MDLLSSFYDSALIYYPNVFFAVLFFFSILGIVLVIVGIIFLWKKIGRVIEKIRNDLKQIKIKEKKKTSFTRVARVFFEKKRFSFVYTIKALTVFFICMLRIIFIRINAALGNIELRTEKILEKIKKEILID
ncbi:MAG TPA: hypothetical protein VJA20_03635 [Candidatus Nanoarchaeia archaeon]|nr:hypothetical protein [Candidatus Nanoarchaeia archaeon]